MRTDTTYGGSGVETTPSEPEAGTSFAVEIAALADALLAAVRERAALDLRVRQLRHEIADLARGGE